MSNSRISSFNYTESPFDGLVDSMITSGASKIYNVTKKYDYEFKYKDFSQNDYVRAIFICLFTIEGLVAVVGNLLVCLTVLRNKCMHSPVNYYIVNLAVCDLLIGAVVLPVKLFELTAEAELNMLNDVSCTMVRYVQSILVFASVFTLVAICFERYNAVVYPVQSRINMTNLRIRRVLAVVWVIPGLVASPNVYPASSVSHSMRSKYGEFTRVTCLDEYSEDFRFWYYLALFVFMYLIPLCLITITCFSIARVLLQEIPIQPPRDPRAISLEQGRRKVAKMVLVVVFSFFICWSPYFMVTVVTQFQTISFLRKGHFFFTMLVINLLAFTNSCVNPFIYFAMSARFRKGFMCIVQSMRNCSRRNRFSPESSQSSLQRTSHRTINGGLTLHTYPSRRNINSNRSDRVNRPGLGNYNHRQFVSVVPGGASSAGCSRSRSHREKNANPVQIIPKIPDLNSKIKIGPVSRNGHDSCLSSQRTILLQISHCGSSSCYNHLVPLIPNDGGGGICHESLENSIYPWNESCNL